MKIDHNTALKEWSSVISAVGAGDQMILVRKGGIADAHFGVEADRFYLFPTWLHQQEREFKPEMAGHVHAGRDSTSPTVPIEIWCQVEEIFRISDLERLQRLEPFVIFTSETLEQRLRFRPDQALHAIAVRAWRLPKPIEIVNDPSYSGCRSWVSIEEEIGIDGSRPVIADGDFRARLDLLAAALR